jgi:sterol desaturase/sphingolipid hydroxylase (fatty acid hydroxylase superfamily)
MRTAGLSEVLGAHIGNFWTLEAGSLIWLPALCLFFWFVERIRPFVRQGALPNATDLKYWLLSPVFELLTRTAAAGAMIACAAFLGLGHHADVWRGFGPVVRQPSWLVLVEMLFLLELTAYWSHRLSHTVPWLWRFHAIHHSATRLNWLSAGRFHPVNQLFTRLCNMVPLFCLGFPIADAMKLFPIVAFSALVAHSNWNLKLGPFSVFLVGPVYHRFHHTLSTHGGNKNFAGFCPVFDKIFGTYYLPERDPGALGVDDSAVPEDIWGQLVHPLRSEMPSPSDLSDGSALPSRPSW